jgi:hypothetical protein
MKKLLYILLTVSMFSCEPVFAQQHVKVWLYDTLWNNTQVMEWADKNVDGFLLSNSAKPFANAHRELLPNCMLPADEWLNEWQTLYPECNTYYADECYTTMTLEQRQYVLDIQKEYPDRLILSEIPSEFFKLLDDGKTRFVYSSYRKFLFRIFSINFSCLFGDQESSVKWLIEMFPGRVPFIWIAIWQVNDFPSLIKFARENRLDIWIYCGNSNNTVEQLITNGNQFMKELNK